MQKYFPTRLFAISLMWLSLVFISTPSVLSASTAKIVTSPFTYNFTVDGTLAETSLSDKSSSGYWWLSSGGRMYLDGGVGRTVYGSLPSTDFWRTLYAVSNPVDTDNGYHPQNLFRLVGRSTWHNLRQEAYFKIRANNLSTSSNRNATNGLFLFNRYKDQNTLYYTGLRVDGYAVIKKKLNGVYTTLAYVKVFPGTYNRTSAPNLLPKDTMIGLRSEVVTVGSKVTIKIYTDVGQTKTWKLVAQATDSGTSSGPIIDNAGFGGIRSDFMDVSFDAYSIREI